MATTKEYTIKSPPRAPETLGAFVTVAAAYGPLAAALERAGAGPLTLTETWRGRGSPRGYNVIVGGASYATLVCQQEHIPLAALVASVTSTPAATLARAILSACRDDARDAADTAHRHRLDAERLARDVANVATVLSGIGIDTSEPEPAEQPATLGTVLGSST